MKEKIGYFSDVHSNLWAMEAMRAVVQSRQDGWEWYFGGDVVGWLFQPIECVKLLMSMMVGGLIKEAVAGNHDLLAFDAFPDLPNQTARKIATAFSAGALSREPESRQFLAGLPLLIDLPKAGCVVTHHSPFCLPQPGENPTIDHFQYLSQDFEPQLAAWAQCQWPVILSGHDHIPAVHRVRAGLEHPTLDDVVTSFLSVIDASLTVAIEPGYYYWVQSGAAGGPPRDGVMMLNWVELAPGERIILSRVPFETSGLKELIERQPFGSLLDWGRFVAKTDKTIAQGRAN